MRAEVSRGAQWLRVSRRDAEETETAEDDWLDRINELTGIVIDEAIRLHRELGPGLLESVYETVLASRLEARGLSVARQFPVPLVIDEHIFEASFRIDILVEQCLILEIKAIDALSKAHVRQLLTYLRLFKQPVGLLLNFSEATMKQGIRRVVNDYHTE